MNTKWLSGAAVWLLALGSMHGAHAGEPPQPVPINAAPWRGLLRVQTELGARCTGFLVAPAVAITAAHCLFLPKVGGFLQAASVHVLLRYRMGQFAAHARVRRFLVPASYDPGREQASPGSDRAILLLDHAIGTRGDAFTLATVPPAPGTPVLLAGYGQGHDEVAVASPPCRVTAEWLDHAGLGVIADDCRAVRGMSGAPLLVRGADGSWRVAGVAIEARAAGAGGVAASLAPTRSGRSSGR